MHAAGAPAGTNPFSGDNRQIARVMTSDDAQSMAVLSQFASDVLTQDVPANLNSSPDWLDATTLAQNITDGAALPIKPHADTISPTDTNSDANTSVIDRGAGGESSAPIVSSGAVFWTVAVDRLDGLGHSNLPVYTAGNDLPVGSLAASHLDQLHTLATVLGSH